MFSGTIKIASLDDYISPSQECILPIFDKNSKLKTTEDPTVKAYGIIPQKPDLIKKTAKQTAKVTLSDCLACSGCVTTAETILQQQQSVEEFLLKLQSYKHVAVGISQQSRASMAYHFGLSEEHIQRALTYFFQDQLNVQYVFDMRFANQLALEQAYREFKKKYENKQSLPVLTSECPGWACYAEKAVGEFIIPYMSQVKSPQQVMGSLVKNALASKMGMESKDILFVSVMPCYDKKVESARKEFERNGIKDVDVVLTTQEIMDLLKKVEGQKLIDVQQQIKQAQTNPNNSNDEESKNQLISKEREFIESNIFPYENLDISRIIISNIEEYIFGESQKSDQLLLPILSNIFDSTIGSNDYLDYIIRRAAADIHHLNPDQYEIITKQGKNSDFNEIFLVKDGTNILSFARVYGLRNIQNITRNLKINKCKYDYVEIMACPSGCLNGGGQLKSLDENMKTKDLIEKLQEILSKKNVILDDQNFNNQAYEQIIKDSTNIYFETIFKHIEKLNTQSSLNW
ncbi:hypothetical protein ABPG72_000463 [Tetrahymena utriculariae]